MTNRLCCFNSLVRTKPQHLVSSRLWYTGLEGKKRPEGSATYCVGVTGSVGQCSNIIFLLNITLRVCGCSCQHGLLALAVNCANNWHVLRVYVHITRHEISQSIKKQPSKTMLHYELSSVKSGCPV